MHSLWDGGIIARISTSEDYWLKELTVLPSSQSQDTTAEGTIEDWETECLLAAREAYQDLTTKQRIKPSAKLGDAYLEKCLPVVRQRLYQARARLAKVPNEAFPKK